MVRKLLLLFLISQFSFLVSRTHAQTSADWYMAGANPQRTSWVSEEVRGNVSVEWYRPIEPYIPYKIQPIAANGRIYVATARGLYAFNAATGEISWVYSTELPLGNSPTVVNINSTWIAYVGGYDRKIHAINAETGQALAGYTAFAADAGFETNPLVVNGVIYAGNRDGTMYALNALTGNVIWSYQAGGSIMFSAAYDANTIYFAANDAFAYALDATNGTLRWKSKLQGGGFRSYWPVVYHPKGTSEVYVSFSGGENYRTKEYHLTVTESDILTAYGSPLLTTVSGITGDWVAGTVVRDAGKISRYYEENSGQYPHRRTVFILNAVSGQEVTTDTDNDGNKEYAPFIWSGVTQSGSRFPAVINGIDGVYYQQTAVESGGWITRGAISGWKFATKYISQVTNTTWATDEPAGYSSGGNVIYATLCCDRGTEGIDISKPIGQPDRSWQYHGYSLEGIAPGYQEMYNDGDPEIYGSGEVGSGGWQLYSGNNKSVNGVYGKHGTVQSPPIPYQGRLFLLKGNSLIALGQQGGRRKLALAAVRTPGTVSQPVSRAELTSRLTTEIQKMLDAGHLKPGYLKNGFADVFGNGGNLDEGWISNYGELFDYFSNPAETVITLLRALPLLDASLQTRVKNYVENYYGPGKTYDFTKIVHIGYGGGADRSAFGIPADMFYPVNANGFGAPYHSPIDPQPRAVCGWCGYWDFNPPIKAYAAWLYAKEFGNATQMYNLVKSSIDSPPSDLTLFKKKPYFLNYYAAGYWGHLQLADLAGQPRSSTVESNLNKIMTARINDFSKDNPYTLDFSRSWDVRLSQRSLSVARNFMYLVPEIADLMANSLTPQVRTAVDEYNYVAPYWFVASFDDAAEESSTQHLYDPAAILQAKAYILKEPYQELTKYIDAPIFVVGDLFYIQNLTAVLSAEGVSPTEPPVTSTPAFTPTPIPVSGDANGDRHVDGVDYVIWLNHYGQTSSAGSTDGDFDNSSRVDGVDYVIWLNHYGT